MRFHKMLFSKVYSGSFFWTFLKMSKTYKNSTIYFTKKQNLNIYYFNLKRKKTKYKKQTITNYETIMVTFSPTFYNISVTIMVAKLAHILIDL